WHYSNTFTAVPFGLPFPPARRTPKPGIPRTQTAIVVGNQDDEIAVDKYGRGKVQFFWDREGDSDLGSSCWIRVAQAWAGKRWGASFWPRVGQEVVVSFLEGDPDQPLIVGSVYNAEQMPPYLGNGLDPKHPDDMQLSGIKTCSTPGGHGFNELRFDDTKGKEQVFLRSQGALDVRALGSQRTSVGGSCHLSVGGEAREKVGGSKQVEVGDLLQLLSENYRQRVKGDCLVACDKHMAVLSGDLLELAAVSRLLLGSKTLIKLKAGPSSITLTPEG